MKWYFHGCAHRVRGTPFPQTVEPLAKLAIEDDLLAESAKKRRVPILPGVKIGLHTKPKRTGE
jgi:hypothetical protein